MLQLRRKQTIVKEIHKGGGPPEADRLLNDGVFSA